MKMPKKVSTTNNNQEALGQAPLPNPNRGQFMTATDINFVLGKLFTATAQNRIPPRNAAVLAYIGQLMLHSLPNLKKEYTFVYKYESWNKMLDNATCLSNSTLDDLAPESLDAPATDSPTAPAADLNTIPNNDADTEPEPDPNTLLRNNP